MRTTLAALILLLSAVVTTAARQAQTEKPADVHGVWSIQIEIAGNTGNPTVSFKQDGEKLTGTYSSPVLGEQQLTGSVKGNELTFTFQGSLEGTAVKVVYTGTVEKDSMKGTVTLGELGDGTFTAKRK